MKRKWENKMLPIPFGELRIFWMKKYGHVYVEIIWGKKLTGFLVATPDQMSQVKGRIKKRKDTSCRLLG